MTDRKSFRNPFLSDVVTNPEQSPPADVPSIHKQAFDLCCHDFEVVAQEHLSWSFCCTESRMWQDASAQSFPAVGFWRDGHKAFPTPALLVAIRMETAPSQIWRHVRRRFAEGLTRRARNGTCPLDEILERFAATRGGDVRQAIEAADIGDLGQDLAKVLEHFRKGRHRPLCRAWLAGDGLSDTDLQLLNLSQTRLEEVEEEFGEEVSRRVVLAIVRLAAPSPVVFCFDQVEALGIAQQGTGSFAPFSRMGAALIDETNNVLVISTVLLTFVRALEDGSMRPDYQRITKSIMELHPLDLKQGRTLIDSRLALIPELAGESPTSDVALDTFYAQQHGSCNARRLIHEARRLFAEWQECEPPVRIPVPGFLQSEFEQAWASAEVRKEPRKSDAVLAHGLPVALELLGRKTTSTGSGLALNDGPSRVDVIFANQSSMQGLAAALRHLLNRRLPDATLCLVRDQRLPISPTAPATRERLKKVEDSGGRFVRVEAEALAVLDAMRQLLTAATSGDLSVNGEVVEPTTVREWLRQNLPQAVQKFASAVLGEDGPLPGADDALLELVGRRKVVSV